MLPVHRSSGILLHPVSLPGRFGIGEIGRGAELWLDDWGLVIALKERHSLIAWIDWPRGVALREEAAVTDARSALEAEIAAAKALQFLFLRQWDKLRVRSKELSISIIGDIPIFAA